MKIKKITEILIGSNNIGKVREIRALLPKKVKIEIVIIGGKARGTRILNKKPVLLQPSIIAAS